MSSTAAGEGGNSFSSWLAHRVWLFDAAIMVSAVPLLVWPDSKMSWGLAVACLLNLWGIRFSLRHGSTLCMACALQVPLNPSEEADRYDRELRVTHYVFERLWPGFASMAIWFLMVAFLPTRWLGLGVILFEATYLWLFWARRKHSILSPWCPYCQDDGDGDGDQEPIPTPDPAMEKVQ